MFLQEIFFQNRENPFSQKLDSGIIDLSLFDSFMITIDNKQKWNSSSSFIKPICNPQMKVWEQIQPPPPIIETKIEIIPPSEIISETDIQTKIQKYTFYASGVQDQIFWTVFIAKYGYKAYSNTGKQFGNIEMKEKQLIADYIHAQGPIEISKQINYKLTRALCCEIVSDLVTSPKMTYSSFIAYCVYYKTSIFIVDVVKKTYIPFLYSGKETDSEPIIIYKNPFFREKKKEGQSYDKKNDGPIKNMFFVEAGQSVLSIDDIRETFLSFEHYDKPLKSISNYKTTDLEEIAEKLEISLRNENKKYKKNELYAKIIEYLLNL